MFRQILTAITLFVPSLIFSQNSIPHLPFSDIIVSGSLNYVSSATIKIAPYSTDIVERNSTIDLRGGYGYSFTIKTKTFRDDLFLGLTAEYIRIQDNEAVQTLENDSSTAKIKMTETIMTFPIELTAYFNIPSFQENLNIYLGGGVGYYFGDRIRKILNFESETISKTGGLSLVIVSGIEYYFEKNAMTFFEMRFREGEYDVKSRFPVSSVTIRGNTYSLGSELNSKVFLDGLKISFGVGYRF